MKKLKNQQKTITILTIVMELIEIMKQEEPNETLKIYGEKYVCSINFQQDNLMWK